MKQAYRKHKKSKMFDKIILNLERRRLNSYLILEVIRTKIFLIRPQNHDNKNCKRIIKYL